MEDIRKICLAYFANLSFEEKKKAENFFNKIFRYRREIGFNEYVEFVRSEGLSDKIANNDCFKVLDVDGNGSLDREEAKPLYYISKSKITTCDMCPVLLTGSFFSCFQCFSDSSKDTFDLCCDCYKDQRFRGRHDHTIFYDNQSLLFNHKDRRQQREKNELQLTAEAYCETVPPEIKACADKFFQEMDKDKNEKIDFDEYISYMQQQGYPKMANYNFFQELNGSGSGQLDFMEVMTLYYIIQSRRPFCEGCNTFMDGFLFTCNECFDGKDDKTFDVCLCCFKTKNYSHKHNNFVDNYALLESKRIEALMEKKRQPKIETKNYSHKHNRFLDNYTLLESKRQQRIEINIQKEQAQPSTSTSTTIVPYDQQARYRRLFFISSLAGIGANIANMLSCSIM